MIQLVRNAISNPLVVAYAALILALTGGTAAYAVATVGSADIIDGSVQSVDIKNKNVKQADLQPAEPWHEVGLPGEPVFQSFNVIGFEFTWTSQTFGGQHEAPAFFRDPYGTVRFKGTVCAVRAGGCYTIDGEDPSDVTIFTLPPGYRPQAKTVFTAMSNKGAIRVDVRPSGEVVTDINIANWVALDSISFRCAPSGSNGCP